MTDDAGAGDDDADDDPLADRIDDDPEGDPFAEIGEGTGPRHGDPFDAIDRATEGEAADDGGSDETTTPSADGPDPAREGLPEGEDPFADFDEQGGDPFAEGTFGDAEAPEIDDGVWERMEATADADPVPGKRYVDVDKHSYCETCKYFSEPPEAACSHEGTEILEFVDMDTVRVVDCPIVAERKAIEDGN